MYTSSKKYNWKLINRQKSLTKQSVSMQTASLTGVLTREAIENIIRKIINDRIKSARERGRENIRVIQS